MEPLLVIAHVARELNEREVEREALALGERVDEGRFNVALLGQFKRGKSSLVNALIGSAVLPTGIVPITAVPTVVRHGERMSARVRMRGTDWVDIDAAVLEQYVSEEHNPENARGVRAIEVISPAPLLARGMCLVDTPGISSVFAGNTAATEEFLPHVDVALVVVGVDPPLTGDELSLVEAVARHAPAVLVVLNKADRFGDAERAQAAAFASRALSARLDRPVGPVYEVSATDALRAAGGPRASTGTFGWSALRAALADLEHTSARQLVRQAHDRGVARLARQLRAEIDERRAALVRPIEASERHVADLATALGEVENRLGELAPLFSAEQQRLERLFAARRGAYLQAALPAARVALDEQLDTLPRRTGPRFRDDALALARRIARERLEPWLAAEHEDAEREFAEGARRLVSHANQFLQRVRAIAPELLARLPDELPAETGFVVPSRYYYHEITPLVQGSPVQFLLDVVRPPGRVREGVRRDAASYLQALLEMNSTLVENDISERVLESRRVLEAGLRALLGRVAESSARALELARAARAGGETAVEADLARLDRSRCMLDTLSDVSPSTDTDT